MNELPIELLYRIALDMDYNTLQNFCKTSQFELRICKNPQFWEDKVNKEFPLDENNWQAIVQETGTAQEAYIRIAGEHDIPFWGAEKYGHIDKLAENAAWTDNFPLINHFYKLSGESGIFYVLGKRNKADFISSFPPKDIEENRDSIMFGALAGGHVDLAQDIIATGGEKINFDAAMWNAAKSGQIPVVEYVLQLMKTQDKKTIIAALNNALSIAIKKQYSHMISFLITEGADNFYRASQKAAEYKNFSLVKEFVSRIGERNVPWDSILYEAAGGGVKEIVDYAIDHGAGDFNAAMLEAAQGGHIHIIEYLISKGADNYIWALLAAINGENIPTIQWLNQRINDLDIEDDVSSERIRETMSGIIITDNVQLYNIATNIFNYDEIDWSEIIEQGSSKILRQILKTHTPRPKDATIDMAGKHVNTIFVLLDYQVKRANINLGNIYHFKLEGRPQ